MSDKPGIDPSSAGAGIAAHGRARAWLAAGLLVVAACSTKSATQGTGHAAGSGRSLTSSAVATTVPGPTTATTPAVTVPTAPATTAAAPVTSTSTAPGLSATTVEWIPLGPTVQGVETLSATIVPAHPAIPATRVVRINAAVTRPVLYAGTAEPGGLWPHQGAVAAAERTGLIAAFNAGFHTYASGGGWYDHGRTAVALAPGAASLVIRADGSSTVGMWGRDVSLTPDVVSVRQNLRLLVDGGADLSATGSWGATLGGVRYTWRSGIGVDAAGNLLYCGGPGLDAHALAQVLIGAGAVRAMELDINPRWVSFSYYTSPGSGADLLPAMFYQPGHWLAGSTRDFIGVFAR